MPLAPLRAAFAAGRIRRIVTYGTSLTAERTWRFWRLSGGAWVTMLRERLSRRDPGIEVHNAAKWGADSAWGRRRLSSRVLRHGPDLVLVEFSINDADRRRGITLERSRENLERMIDAILAARPGCAVVPMTMSPPLGRHLAERPRIRDYYGVYREVARERGLPLLDHEPAWRRALGSAADGATLLPDGIHPGVEGCREVVLPGVLGLLDGDVCG